MSITAIDARHSMVLPVHRNSPMHVIVKIIDIKTKAIVNTHDVNYSRKASREWLARTLFWAWHNNKYVEIYNKEDVA